MKIQAIIVWTILLIVIDQLIKIIIYNFYGEMNFEIIPSLLEFKPSFNVKHSWVNTLLNKNLGINVGLLPHLILYVFIGIFVPLHASYFRNNIPQNKKLIELASIFLMATVICALLGNIIWQKGTLDYIYLKSFFIFDLKDLFADIGVILFLFYVFMNKKQLDELMKDVKVKDVYKDAMIRLKAIRN